MVKKMTFKQFLFILPLLIFIGVFSIYPIVTSFMYTFLIIALMIRPQTASICQNVLMESCSMRIVIISIIFWMMIRL